MINRTFFFERVKWSLFAGRIAKSQVDGLNFILDVWEATHSHSDDRWLAYALGTTFHEVAYTMQPIHEKGSRAYFIDRYDITGSRPNFARRVLGNIYEGDGPLFHGRGYVQLTGRRNYTVMGDFFQVDLTSSDQAANGALDPKLAARIMFKGMEDGIFTGKRFANYFNGATADWVQARRIINGLDQAPKIAGHAREFYAAISYTT